MKYVLSEEEVICLNDIVGSLMISQFNNQDDYRDCITNIITEFFNLNLEERKTVPIEITSSNQNTLFGKIKENFKSLIYKLYHGC